MRPVFALLGVFSLLSACASPPGEEPDEEWGASENALSSFSFATGFERENASATTTLVRQRSSVHFGNAYGLARLSQLAYEDEAGFRAGLGGLGIGDADVVSFANRCTGAFAYYVSSGDFRAVTFRGTEPHEWADLEADDPGLGKWRGAGEIGAGYDKQFLSVWKAAPSCGVTKGLAEVLATRRGGELYVTGHSLGGALATVMLAETLVAKEPVPVTALYTFGSPKVGDADFGYQLTAKAAAAKTAMFRFVRKNDIVTGQPRIVSHDGAGMYFYRHFSAKGEGEAAYQVYVDAKQYKIGELVVHPLWSIPDHAIGGYAEDIKAFAVRRGQMR